jgi:enamine deaminase RidA (YjgF/YER057c/UK114 family)
MVSGGLTAQFAQALRNILDVVRESGGGPESIGRFTIYVTDKGKYLAETGAIGRAYRELMGKHFPAMSLVQVAALLEEGAEVEIEATAVIP